MLEIFLLAILAAPGVLFVYKRAKEDQEKERSAQAVAAALAVTEAQKNARCRNIGQISSGMEDRLPPLKGLK